MATESQEVFGPVGNVRTLGGGPISLRHNMASAPFGEIFFARQTPFKAAPSSYVMLPPRSYTRNHELRLQVLKPVGDRPKFC